MNCIRNSVGATRLCTRSPRRYSRERTASTFSARSGMSTLRSHIVPQSRKSGSEVVARVTLSTRPSSVSANHRLRNLILVFLLMPFFFRLCLVLVLFEVGPVVPGWPIRAAMMKMTSVIISYSTFGDSRSASGSALGIPFSLTRCHFRLSCLPLRLSNFPLFLLCRLSPTCLLALAK